MVVLKHFRELVLIKGYNMILTCVSGVRSFPQFLFIYIFTAESESPEPHLTNLAALFDIQMCVMSPDSV